MSKLEEYYQFVDNLNNKGELSDEQRALYNRVEEELILDEVCHHIGEIVKDELAIIRRAATFVIDYDPNGRIVVKAAHNRSSEIFINTVRNCISDTDELAVQDIASDADNLHTFSDDESEELNFAPSQVKRSPRKNFKAILDGKEITGDGATVLTETIRQIGFKRVAKLGIMMAKGEYNLVGKHKREDGDAKWQRKIGDWFIYTNSSNPIKIEQLYRIAKELNLNLQVVEENPNEEAKTLVQETPNQTNIDYKAKDHKLPIKEQARKFMSEQRSDRTANLYINTLDNAVHRYILELEPESDSIFSYTTVEGVSLIINLLNGDADFNMENRKHHYNMTAALNLYRKFIESRHRE